MLWFFSNLFRSKDPSGHSHKCTHCNKLCEIYGNLRIRVCKLEGLNQDKSTYSFFGMADSLAFRISNNDEYLVSLTKRIDLIESFMQRAKQKKIT